MNIDKFQLPEHPEHIVHYYEFPYWSGPVVEHVGVHAQLDRRRVITEIEITEYPAGRLAVHTTGRRLTKSGKPHQRRYPELITDQRLDASAAEMFRAARCQPWTGEAVEIDHYTIHYPATGDGKPSRIIRWNTWVDGRLVRKHSWSKQEALDLGVKTLSELQR
jgi:hypothetical protein